jgi:hypothetical protein
MPLMPEAIILVLATFTPLFWRRIWLHAQVLLLGAMLAPGAHTVTAALRAMGWLQSATSRLTEPCIKI